MSLKLETRERQDTLIVDLYGQLILGDATSRLRELMRQINESGCRRILINMEGLHKIDSSGMGELISAYTTAVKSGGEVKLVNLTSRISDLMKLTKLCTVFDVFEDEDQALDSFSEETKSELQRRWGAFMGNIVHRPHERSASLPNPWR